MHGSSQLSRIHEMEEKNCIGRGHSLLHSPPLMHNAWAFFTKKFRTTIVRVISPTATDTSSSKIRSRTVFFVTQIHTRADEPVCFHNYECRWKKKKDFWIFIFLFIHAAS
ncbi:hypothetical protein CEXT_594741 [Caerostris extrusa]|uniref:Uncharacterized protein n=1 Tax=Caerostris extrusa TaxID=172846 RepID=A0AAV4YAH2_CAEEX|nr:hypothetical protein CEXT_594741 [Caerostris extrusa]